jgi:hypothetical protein
MWGIIQKKDTHTLRFDVTVRVGFEGLIFFIGVDILDAKSKNWHKVSQEFHTLSKVRWITMKDEAEVSICTEKK